LPTSPKDEDRQFDDRLMDRPYSCVMNDRITAEGAIEKAEQYEAIKQILLRLLDDPQSSKNALYTAKIDPEHVQSLSLRSKQPT
jgi:hypothetical protein